MAAQDLIISRRGPVSSNSYLDADAADSVADGASILFGTIRRRWLLMAFIAIAALGLGIVASMQFGKHTAVVDSALIYTGLPSGAFTNAADPLGAATGAEMIASIRVLNQLCEREDVGMSPGQLGDQITATNGRSSSLLNLTLVWDDVDKGIDLLNKLMAIFIEEMASQRKGILRDHLQHLNLSMMQASEREDRARQTLESLREKQEQQLDKGGQSNDQYRVALNNLETAKSRVVEKRTEQMGVKEQIDRVTGQIAEKVKAHQEVEQTIKNDLLQATEAVLKSALKGRAPGHPVTKKIEQTVTQIRQYVTSKDSPQNIDRWQKGLAQFLSSESSGLSEDNLTKLSDEFVSIRRENDQLLTDFASQRRNDEEKLEQKHLQMIQINHQLAAYLESGKESEKKVAALAEKITGISATEVQEAEHLLDDAQTQKNELTIQRDSLSQLHDSRLREWTVSVPASTATTRLDSNHIKLFVLVFALFGLLFSAPLFAAEWHTQTGSPQIRLARSLRVPVLAERILEHFSPSQRKSKKEKQLGADDLETIRMLALRIQQSCHQPGSVVLFSSLDSTISAAPLMATVAECLAEREERVLLIDAVSPDRALMPVQNLLSAQKDGAQTTPSENGKNDKHGLATALNGRDHSNSPGLSEYLSEDCDAVGELIRPTGCPGVDLISSGRAGFPREAMASSCLTELLNTCRRNYTMLLVHGPAADCAADLQMLTARADGVVLVATKTAGKNSRIREAVQDLLDLGAPVIGLVA